MSLLTEENAGGAGSAKDASEAATLSGAARRTFIEPGTVPYDALTWKTAAEGYRVMGKWRRALFFSVTTETRLLKLGCVLGENMVKHGYAYARDPYLAVETQLTERNVRATVKRLRELGAISDVWVIEGGKQHRRIYPMASVIRGAVAEGFVASEKGRSESGPTIEAIGKAKGRPKLGPTSPANSPVAGRPDSRPKGRSDGKPTEYKEPKKGALTTGRWTSSKRPFQPDLFGEPARQDECAGGPEAPTADLLNKRQRVRGVV